MKKQMIISVMSKDRPGIVADITGAIYELDGDLADLNQTVLHGYLTMILIVIFPDNVTSENILAKFSDIKSAIPFEVMIKQVEEEISFSGNEPVKDSYIVTAQGQNKSGLVYGISRFCHERNINILDLATTLDNNLYTMVLQLDLRDHPSIDKLQNELEEFARQTGLGVTLQHDTIFQATNEVTL